jgi:hypothetical protein
MLSEYPSFLFLAKIVGLIVEKSRATTPEAFASFSPG